MSNNPQQPINAFVATLEDLLRFLESYKNDLFYFDINPSQPPTGARQFEITTFPASVAERVIAEIHPGVTPPRITPGAKAKIEGTPPDDSQPPTVTFECGMNVHPKHGQAYPNIPKDLAKVDWVRFPFTSSPAHFPNLEAAFAFFDPAIDAYRKLGCKILVVLTHETYGEAAGYNFLEMDSQKWAAFTNAFVATAERIIRHYGDRIQAYEIWNEGDALPGNPAAVSFPARDYAPLLDRVSKLVRTHAPNASVVLGGLVRGPGIGAQYITTIKSVLNGRLPVDAIGVHPYGKGAPSDKTVFSQLGNIDDDIRIFNTAAPKVPLWLTEVGALGANDPQYWSDAAAYLKSLYSHLRKNYAERVPVVIWYAWSDSMDVAQKTNGIVTADGKPKPFVYEAFFGEACKS